MGGSDGGFNGAFRERMPHQDEVMEILSVSTRSLNHFFVTDSFKIENDGNKLIHQIVSLFKLSLENLRTPTG